ncbi:OmpA family protein [bacterium]|nr:OmpA family protein [bacterium]
MKNISFLIVVLFSLLHVQAQVVSDTLFYGVDDYHLSEQHKSKLRSIFKQIPSYSSIDIIGYADSSGSFDYNDALSKNRASNVAEYVKSLSEEEVKIKVSFKGEGEAKQGNMAQNRRVVLSYNVNNSHIRDLFKELANPLQRFCIKPNRDTVITGQQGTVLHIKAGTFKANKCVNIELKEAYTFSDMLLENLNTTSNGQLLSTQGMVYLNAMVDGDTVKPKKEITIMMPSDGVDPDAKIFDGERDPHSDVMNWTVNNSSVLRSFNVVQVDRCITTRGNCLPCFENSQSFVYNSDSIASRCRDYFYSCIQGALGCYRCKFLCRIARAPLGLLGIVSRDQHWINKEFRACQRSLRRLERMEQNAPSFSLDSMMSFMRITWPEINFNNPIKNNKKQEEIYDIYNALREADAIAKSGTVSLDLAKCEELQSLMQTYDVETLEELFMAINKPLLDEFGVDNMPELMSAIQNRNLDDIEVAYQNKEISFQDYNFYIFNSSNLGWKNIDVFADLAGSELVDMVVKFKPDSSTDFKIVIPSMNFVIAADIEARDYQFKDFPKDLEAYIVGLRYENGVPLFFMLKTLTQKLKIDPDFKSLSLEELKGRLRELEF